jgi:hypothetical protein
MTEHASWLVSVTPKNNGSFITPGGQRFDITMHDGFTAEMVTAAIAEMDKAAAFLLPANGIPGPKEQPRQDAASDEGPQNSGAGEEVFSVGWVNCGDEFIAEVARLVPAASGKKQHAEVYTPHSKYPLTRIDERFFAAIKQATGSDLTFGEEVTFDPPREIVFKLSHKNKQNSDRHYIDFVRVCGSSSAPAAANDADGEGNERLWSNHQTLISDIAGKIGMSFGTVQDAIVRREQAGEVTADMSQKAVFNMMVAAAKKAKEAANKEASK